MAMMENTVISGELLVCWGLMSWNLVATTMAVQAEMVARMSAIQAGKTAKAW
jgi:hypothetical protein